MHPTQKNMLTKAAPLDNLDPVVLARMVLICLGISIPPTTPGYPLRTPTNKACWETLEPLAAVGSSAHLPGGKRNPLSFQAHFGGRSKKGTVVDEPYTLQNPCKIHTLGKGPVYLGFYCRPEHLTRCHRRKGRGPRCKQAMQPDA